MLPQVALGHSQTFILNSAHFENEILHLSEIMIPPMSSNTMSGTDILGASNKSNNKNNDNTTEDKKIITQTKVEKESGRPEKPDDEKAEKTI